MHCLSLCEGEQSRAMQGQNTTKTKPAGNTKSKIKTEIASIFPGSPNMLILY